MAKRKVTARFKTKSKKNKSKKTKHKKSAKEEREKETKKIGLGLKDICSALTELQVSASDLKEQENTSSDLSLGNQCIQNSRKCARKERKRKKVMCRKTESNISRLFQKLSCSTESSNSNTSGLPKFPCTKKVMPY